MKKTPLKRKTPLRRGQFRRNSRDKYGAVHCADKSGNQFDSKTERARFAFLQAMERSGLISDLTLHPKVVLIARTANAPEIAYKPDYSYTENGRTVYEDSKARPADHRDRLIWKLWRHFGPGVLIITGDTKSRWKTKKKIKGAARPEGVEQ